MPKSKKQPLEPKKHYGEVTIRLDAWNEIQARLKKLDELEAAKAE